jgi:hypothetical protein
VAKKEISMAKVAFSEKTFVLYSGSAILGHYETVEEAKKEAALAVTRADKAYGTSVYVLKPVVKVETPQPEATFTEIK